MSSNVNETNEATAFHATQRGALPLHRLMLIGVMGTGDTPRALLRTHAGQIRQVSVGDQLRQGTVVAIADDAITLAARNGSTTVMRIPEAVHEVEPAA